MPDRRTRPSPARPDAGGAEANAARVGAAYRLLDVAVARLARQDGTDYQLSVSCQAGILQDCWLESGRLGDGAAEAAPDASGAAAAIKDGRWGDQNRRAYAAALEALAAALTTLLDPPGSHGCATVRLQAQSPGVLRLPVELETVRRRRFGA